MAISEAEKIRKAEEIYYRRNGIKVDKQEKKKKGFFSWLIKNIIFCTIIIGAFYAYTNKEYIMSEAFKSDLKNILNTQININEIWNKIIGKQNNEIIEENAVAEIKPESETLKISENNTVVEEGEPQPITVSYTYIMPLNGEITSTFGYRESENANVTGNHTGIDIAGNIGDKIIASASGSVIQVSSEGDYGNHLKIQNGEMITLYAHCNQIYVSEGEEIVQGQEIAEVGNTGNSTGPHLHFEIRKNNEYLNPLDYIEKI